MSSSIILNHSPTRLINGNNHQQEHEISGSTDNNEIESIKRNSFDRNFVTDNVQSSLSHTEPSSVRLIENVCDEMLGNKMNGLKITTEECKNVGCDGSDSGVDIATCLSVGLQRALSSNSGGYVSSNDFLDEPNLNGNISCDSSMISYNSDIGESHKIGNTMLAANSNYECTSENGSESSSVNGDPNVTRKQNTAKKKIGLPEPTNYMRPSKRTVDLSPCNTTAAGQFSGTQKNLRRPVSVSRTQSLTRPSPPILQTRERARSRDKSGASSSSSKAPTPPFRSTPVRSRPPKPDSLPAALITASPSIQRLVQRTPSLTRSTRTPGTPSDDGRWPSVGARNGPSLTPKRGCSAIPDLASLKSRVNMMSLDAGKSSPTNAYATLPRRKKQKSVEDLTNGRSSRSNSRDKMTSSVILAGKKAVTTSQRDSTPSKNNSPFIRPRKLAIASKTKIYHEIEQQTVITGQDVEQAFAGKTGISIKIDATEVKNKSTQSEIRDKELEALQLKIRQLTDHNSDLESRLEEKTKKVLQIESLVTKEREDKIAIQKELHLNTERVIGMLEMTGGAPTEEPCYDSLLMLESQIQMSGHELNEKQQEINKLRRVCRTLQNEVERSMIAQECLMNEKSILEKESLELQDFLQYEKTALSEALKDCENDMKDLKTRLEDKEEENKVLRDECRHLVRLNEQRRQENKTMQSKYAALENRNRELASQKTSAISGASMALNGLNSRLDNLVEQLISSYSISEQDLEDIVFHNEAYTQSTGNSVDGSPANNFNNNDNQFLNSTQTEQNDGGSLSPQRNQSFIAAVINAIKNATTSSKKTIQQKQNKVQNDQTNEEESDSTEMLDSETEPCLMMDNVLEDVTMPDSHSHNMVSSTCGNLMLSQIELPSELMIMQGDESLHNLSQAITNRQQIEMQMASQKLSHLKNQIEPSSMENSCHDSLADMPSISEYCPSQVLVDQVIEVDNLVTKLLKVLRLIQMDNDNCIQQLITDKNKLQLNKEEMLEKFKEIEDTNVKLRDELMDATQELMMQGNDLTNSKNELQHHRNEIDKLNEDICELSQICIKDKNNSIASNEIYYDHIEEYDKDKVLEILNLWKEKGSLQEPDVLEFILKIYKEFSFQKYFHFDNDICVYPHILNDNNLINESKKQYDIIDHALDVLYSLQNFVDEHPPLLQLQKDLEENNFNTTTTTNMPLYTSLMKSKESTSKTTNNYLNENDSISMENYYDCDGNSTDITLNTTTSINNDFHNID